MELTALIAGLGRREAYPHPVSSVEVRQTHISVVFLTDDDAYKIKKPVKLDFLDFSTLDRRRHICGEEVSLNRRLAPHVYRGVVPVTLTEGQLRFGGAGVAVEYAVWMRRLPDSASLLGRLERAELEPATIAELGRRLASFHAGAGGGAGLAAAARYERVRRLILDNFSQSRGHVGNSVSADVHGRLERLSELELERSETLIASRAARQIARDTHGDLHLDHVYWFPERPPPDDFVAIDCIEFNPAFRHADPVADIAFLWMDLAFRGRRDLAAVLADSYFQAAADAEGRALLPLYVSYRAAVRAKVEGIQALEPEVPALLRAQALERSRAHWLFALGELEAPARRPCLVLVAGLPGTGKSTLARELSGRADLSWVRSDAVRKELAELAPDVPAGRQFGQGIYTPEWTARTYAECARRARERLALGGRVLVDANFSQEWQRLALFEVASEAAVPALLFHCRTDPAEVKRRLDARTGDVSDADWSVYERARAAWEPFGARAAASVRELDTGSAGEALELALAALTERGLA